jgi:hypothetical protein
LCGWQTAFLGSALNGRRGEQLNAQLTHQQRDKDKQGPTGEEELTRFFASGTSLWRRSDIADIRYATTERAELKGARRCCICGQLVVYILNV